MNLKAALAIGLMWLLAGCNLPVPGGEPPENQTAAVQGQAATPAAEETEAGVTVGIPFAPQDAPAASILGRGVQDFNILLPPYGVQANSPVQTSNFLFPDQGCNWTGVGGQVFSRQGEPITGLVVELSGILDGQTVVLLTLTGSAVELGPGGYAITLGLRPLETQGRATLQVYNLLGEQLTGKVPLYTSADCERSLTVLNFVEIDPQVRTVLFFPFVANR